VLERMEREGITTVGCVLWGDWHRTIIFTGITKSILPWIHFRMVEGRRPATRSGGRTGGEPFGNTGVRPRRLEYPCRTSGSRNWWPGRKSKYVQIAAELPGPAPFERVAIDASLAIWEKRCTVDGPLPALPEVSRRRIARCGARVCGEHETGIATARQGFMQGGWWRHRIDHIKFANGG